jgi:hypothetical protein
MSLPIIPAKQGGTGLTSLAALPISTAQQAALDLKADKTQLATPSVQRFSVADGNLTAGQTTITVGSYTPGTVMVFLNGSKLPSSSYTASSGTTVVLADAALATDVIEVLSWLMGGVQNAAPLVHQHSTADLTGPALPQVLGGLGNANSDTSSLFVQAEGGSSKVGHARRASYHLTPEDFGAKGDGATDDAPALQAWLNALTTARSGFLPAKTYVFRSPLARSTGDFAIIGSGPYQSALSYDGTDTTVDLIKIGDSSGIKNVHLSNFRIASRKTMTAGTALHLRLLQRSHLNNITIDGLDGNGNLWNGIWFNSVDQVTYSTFEIWAQNEGLICNGAVAGPKAGLFVSGGFKISNCNVGVHVAGAFGGFYINDGDVINNGTNLLIDTANVAEGNREVFLGSNLSFDTATNITTANIVVDDSLVGGAYLNISGTWLSYGPAHGLWVKNWPNSHINFTGGTVFNHAKDGVRVEDGTAYVTLTGTALRYNDWYGINPTVGPNRVRAVGVVYSGNGLGTIKAPNNVGVTYKPPLSGYIDGLTLSNNATTPLTVLDIAAGTATSGDGSETIELGSILSKSVTAAWVAGSGNGSLDTGSVAPSTYYHVWLIKNPTTNVVDVLTSTSATSPTMPSGYTLKRRIGAISINSSTQVVQFKQIGNTFLRSTTVTNSFTSSGSTAASVSGGVPPGVQVDTLFRASATWTSAGAVLFSSLDVNDEAPTFPNTSLAFPANGTTSGEFRIRTNTSSSIRYRASASGITIGLQYVGWVDPRN